MDAYSTNEVRCFREGLPGIEGRARFRLLSEIASHYVQEILDGVDQALARKEIIALLSGKINGRPLFLNDDRSFIIRNIDDELAAVDECDEISGPGGIEMCERPMAEWPIGERVYEEQVEPELEPEVKLRRYDGSLGVDFEGIFGCVGKDVDKSA